MSLEAKIKLIISEQLGVELSEVVNSADFINDLDADSLDIVELVMALEEEFGVNIPDTAAERITTVQSSIDYLQEVLGSFNTITPLGKNITNAVSSIL